MYMRIIVSASSQIRKRPLVPHVRITKLRCYCKHSVLCIGLGLGSDWVTYSHTWACYYMTPYIRKLPKKLNRSKTDQDKYYNYVRICF